MTKIQSERLSQTVAERLMHQIFDQGLEPGEKLPTEPELMEIFGVSRTVIREAAALLVSRGVVDVRPRRGMTVRLPDGKGVADSLNAQLQICKVSLQQLLQVRMVQETAIARIAATERTDEDVRILRENLDALLAHRNDRERTIKFDTKFHDLLAAATHNPFFSLVCKPIIELLRSLYTDTAKDKYMSLVEETYSEHKAILDAIEMKDADGAEKAMRDHLIRAGRNVTANDFR